MMDISMYGNHHSTHTSGFQSPDLGSGGYPYFATTPHHHHHIQSHQMHSQNAVSAVYAAQVIPNNASGNPSSAIQSASNSSNHLYSATASHPHLYSPSAIEYGIHTSSANNSPSEQYFEHGESGYYNSGNASNGTNNNGSPMPENHIISSDNGLSYTNLDYIAYQQAHGNQAYLHGGADEKLHLPHHYNEEIIMAGGQTPLHHHAAGNNHWHHAHSHGYQVENGANHSNQMNISAMPGNSLPTQQQINLAMHSPNGIQPSQSTSPTLSQQQQQSQQNVPQYKWMQVKRNVPKPQSESIEIVLAFQ